MGTTNTNKQTNRQRTHAQHTANQPRCVKMNHCQLVLVACTLQTCIQLLLCPYGFDVLVVGLRRKNQQSNKQPECFVLEALEYEQLVVVVQRDSCCCFH